MRTLLLLPLLALPVAADYALPVAQEIHYLVIDEWKVEVETLVTPSDRWPIDLLWMADRINSNLICCGDYAKAMRKHLEELKGPLLAEMVRCDGDYFVANLRPLAGDEKKLRAASAVSRIVMDLRLEVKLLSPQQAKRGEAIRFDVRLRNVSKGRTRRVVKPGDGSGARWREPHLFFSVRFGNEELEAMGLGRCGMFDADWRKDVVDLKPGDSLAIQDWLPPASALFRFERDGTYRIRLHYRYDGGGDEPGKMGTIPAFTVVSDPVRILVR